MSQPHPVIAENPQKEARTANWVALIICTALLFDGYDLVIILPIAWLKLIEERVILHIGAAPQKSGFAAVFSRQFAAAAILLGLMSFCGHTLCFPADPEPRRSGGWPACFSARGQERAAAGHRGNLRTGDHFPGTHDVQLSAAAAFCLYRPRRRGNTGHPGADLRVPVQLLHHQCEHKVEEIAEGRAEESIPAEQLQ